MMSINGPPAPEHPMMVKLYVISKLSMTPDTVHVMVRVVAVGEVTWRSFTGPGAVTGGSVTGGSVAGGSVGMGPTVVGSAVVGSVVVGEAIVGSIGVVMAMGGAE